MDMTYPDGGAKWWLNQTAKGSSMLDLVDVGDVDTREGNESRSEALVDLNCDGKIDWVRSCQGQNFKVDYGDGKGRFAADRPVDMKGDSHSARTLTTGLALLTVVFRRRRRRRDVAFRNPLDLILP